MGNQIIRQPDGNYAIFSTGTDTIIVYNASAEEIIEYFVERAAEDTRRQVRDLIQHVAAGNARAAYFQFALSWDEVLVMDREHGGEAWREFRDTMTECGAHDRTIYDGEPVDLDCVQPAGHEGPHVDAAFGEWGDDTPTTPTQP